MGERKGMILCPTGYGDVADQVSILRIKVERLSEPAKRAHAQHELDTLEAAWKAEGLPALEDVPGWSRLYSVNSELWDVEDMLREHERNAAFDLRFVGLARSVYRLNDERATVKRAINVALGSALIEQKSYA